MKKLLKKITPRRLKKRAPTPEPTPKENVPRITNETIAEHREEVLSSARKYIYPLQHSKHKVVLISTTVFITALVVFFTYCTAALYKFQSSSTFIYRVTQVIPLPVARTGRTFIAYENYLFELRRYMHYYQNQQKLDFGTESGKQQLQEFKKQALTKVIDFAYIKKAAVTRHVTVKSQEVEDEITLLKMQNRLGSGDKVFEDVLRDYFGWSRDDFKRYLYQELLTQKVLASLDTASQQKATAAMSELKSGADFAAVAKKYSDDVSSKDTGGEFGFLIDKTNRDVTPQAVNVLFKLQPGQFSDVVNTGNNSLEIFKSLEVKDGKVRGAHILFNFKDINSYVSSLKDKQKTRLYINEKL